MRNIMQTVSTANILLLILVVLIGCNNEAQDQSKVQPIVKEDVVQSPGSVDASIVSEWFALGDIIAEGTLLSADKYDSLLGKIGYKHYLRGNNNDFNSFLMSNISNFVFSENSSSNKKTSPKRTDILENFKYIKNNREKLSTLPAKWNEENIPNKIHALLTKYTPDHIDPSRLDVHLTVCEPSISYGKGTVLSIDAGLAAAAPTTEIINISAAHCFRVLMPLESKPYLATTGKSALTATFHQLRIEAIASWIEGYPDIWFDRDHPFLNRPDQNRNNVYVYAPFNVVRVNSMVETLFSSREMLDESGGTIDDLLRINQSYPGTGYAMAALIVNQLGEERLIACADNTSLFLDTYQEAASTGNATGNHAKMHPFDDEVIKQLKKIL